MNKITDWMLEQYVLAELPADDMRSIRQQASQDAALQARINQIHNSNRALMRAIPPQAFAASVANAVAADKSSSTQQRQQRRQRQSHFWAQVTGWWQQNMGSRAWTTIGAAALMSVFVIMLLPTIINTPQTASVQVTEEGVRLKGLTSSFRVYRLEQDEPHRLSVQNPLQAGDLLQLSYVAAGQAYGYLVSVDGNNVITVHLANAGQSVALLSDGEVRLAEGYKLDDAPGFERFIFVTSPEPFPTEIVDRAINALLDSQTADYGQLVFPTPPSQSFSVTSMTFLKADKE